MTKIQIKGMTCNHCKMRVEKALKQAGCGKVKVELETGTATADTRGLSAEQIRETIESLGFQCGDVSDM
ncbi:MAG TPA: copper chaperone [Clostridiales bacterium]|jgi:copper ion binding protein|nr:heavy-metal-associated domain-containing protein [Subdoligranulum sp.]PWM87307.1 MAG: copper chaperone [Subdoligranulum sp.]PWM87309.1 MAG: copper chaperone [Subdoligranulum sp.]CDE71411.1 copper ion binding protein [Subdoligranulum sp. CAG:314]HCW81724.1 copper chaperone [Clostridiales bacterium]